MRRDPRAFLWDVQESATQIQLFGEALAQLAKLDTAMAARIPDLPKIVAFRNQLIHGYATVNVSTVWNVVQASLPALLSQTKALLDELGEA